MTDSAQTREAVMVFDVESVGLHGEGFAVGWTVIGADGKEIGFGEYGCDPALADGTDEGRSWVAENVTVKRNCESPLRVRDEFWGAWMWWRDRGALLASDVPFPVEARFLSDCIREDSSRQSPYPLIDVASVLHGVGRDPIATYPRLERELPAHNPLADARQSARMYHEAAIRADANRARDEWMTMFEGMEAERDTYRQMLADARAAAARLATLLREATESMMGGAVRARSEWMVDTLAILGEHDAAEGR